MLPVEDMYRQLKDINNDIKEMIFTHNVLRISQRWSLVRHLMSIGETREQANEYADIVLDH